MYTTSVETSCLAVLCTGSFYGDIVGVGRLSNIFPILSALLKFTASVKLVKEHHRSGIEVPDIRTR